MAAATATSSLGATRLPQQAVSDWRRKAVAEWSPVEVTAFLEAVLPGHESNARFGHMTGRVLASLTKEDLRKHAKDDEATNVIKAELARLHEARRHQEDIAAKGAHPYTLFIRTPADVAVELEVRPGDTVREVKERVAALEGTMVEAQRLMWNGVPMLDSRTLASYNITHQSVVLLVPRLASTGHRYAAPSLPKRGGFGSQPTTSSASTAPVVGNKAVGSGIPRPRVPVVCNDIARPFPMSLEFTSIPEYQAFMIALQREAGRRESAASRVANMDWGETPRSPAPFLEILPADNVHAPVQTRILFDSQAEVLIIDTVGDILMESARYKALLHLKDEQKMTHLVTGLMGG